MKTAFRAWDANRKGYLTKEDVLKRTDKLLEIYPDIDIEPARQQSLRFWVEACNLGLPVPEDYRLTEAQFLQNMWKSVKQPSLMELMRDMIMRSMEYMDKEKKGYISKEDYMNGATKFMKAEHASAAFDCMACDGKITAESMLKAARFYYTDTDSVDHPLNLMRGPLVDD